MQLSRILTGSIRSKLIASIAAILLGGIAAVQWISTNLQIQDSRLFMLEGLSDAGGFLNQRFSTEVQQALTRARGWVIQSVKGEDLSSLMNGDTGIMGIQLLDMPDATPSLSGFQKIVENSGEIHLPKDALLRVSGGEEVYGVADSKGISLHFFALPFVKEGDSVKKILAVYLDTDMFKAAFKSDGTKESFLFDLNGKILYRSESIPGQGLGLKQLMPKKLVKSVISSPLTNSQTTVSSEDGRPFVGDYHKTSVKGVTVAVFTAEDRIYDTPRKIAVRSTYLALAILSLALVFAIFFSDSIVKPIQSLVEVTRAIAQGDFSVRAKPTTKDELATLSNAFNDMASGLAEREHMKEVFGKFHSKAVFQKLLQEDRIRLGGEKIPVTVFFSDIRSFTSSSEKMEPEAVVEMLNEYMSEMVAVIEKWDGVVDKYVGDAIMAIWGMPTQDPAKDAEKAALACLEMREKLAELNERRRERGQPPIQIGMGLNSGEVIAGNIGSPSRMEYTVIGDTVNTASRMESLTKEHKTDFLMNESTAKMLVDGRFILLGPIETAAKGKAEPILVFGCEGLAEGLSLEQFASTAQTEAQEAAAAAEAHGTQSQELVPSDDEPQAA